ncbi:MULTISPECIES: PEP-CTERM sorting domain-containing protein [unclassified Marinobacter]|uniref:PEP-CTERM sorting domain-containing protein n=1 Tax=unclassified Marinobacter TaxID=83889 RepID=UPI000BF67B68|nr:MULTISPECIES: PEP-CTERM sorting domain-containing protein [unclassified Marinobacter]PFG10550.1 putative secreted protein with PEP-CTERM sorting signal [Marinobacter sp. LV10MA510-1]PFG52472.1 putative secreted protein with PEP-CTERM sorting signal [Marinobacter sp. LV10R520-4]
MISNKKKADIVLATTFILAMPAAALAAPISDLDNQPWQTSLTAADGTAEIVDLTGFGGNLENNAPLQTGAVKLQTGSTTGSRAEIQLRPIGGFGTVNDLFDTNLSFSYSMYKGSTGAAEPAPSFKMQFYNSSPTLNQGGYTQLIFEPYWNQLGAEGSSSAVPAGDWTDYTVNFTSGLLWSTGGFGASNSAGGPPLRSLEDWLSTLNADFGDANLFGISLGMGTNTPNQIGYVDNVSINAGNYSKTFDFEAAVEVPAPASLPLLLIGLLGMAAKRFRRHS